MTRTWHRHFLVIANVTAMSDELFSALSSRAEAGPTTFTLVVPASAVGGPVAAREQIEAAIARMQKAGLTVEGQVGDADPIVAVKEAWDPTRYDEIVICTLPMRLSKWLHAALPQRIAELTGAPVTHVIAHPPPPPSHIVPAPPESARLSPLLAPFAAFGPRTRDRPDPSRRGS